MINCTSFSRLRPGKSLGTKTTNRLNHLLPPAGRSTHLDHPPIKNWPLFFCIFAHVGYRQILPEKCWVGRRLLQSHVHFPEVAALSSSRHESAQTAAKSILMQSQSLRGEPTGASRVLSALIRRSSRPCETDQDCRTPHGQQPSPLMPPPELTQICERLQSALKESQADGRHTPKGVDNSHLSKH